MAKTIGTSDLLDVWASSGAKVEPVLEKKEQGWALGEQPPHEFMNWLQATFGEKLNHILANGVPAWNDATDYEAGAVVNHSGSVWQATIASTDSEPAALNEDWASLLAAGGDVEVPSSAVSYDNTESGLDAEDVQAAIDEVVATKAGLADANEFTQTQTLNGIVSKKSIREVPFVGNAGSAFTVNFATHGTNLDLLLNQATCEFTFPSPTAGLQFSMKLKQDGTGGRTVTLPASVRWDDEGAPDLSVAAGLTDRLVFEADGTYWMASAAGIGFDRS